MDGRAGPGALDTSVPVRVWIYDAQTRQERDVMELAPELDEYYRVPVVLFFGIAYAGNDEHGRARMVPTVLRTYGKLPYMYIRAPPAWQHADGRPPSDDDLERVAARLDDAIWERVRQPYQRRTEDDVAKVEARGRKLVVRQKGLGKTGGGGRQTALSFGASSSSPPSDASSSSSPAPSETETPTKPPLPPGVGADELEVLMDGVACAYAAEPCGTFEEAVAAELELAAECAYKAELDAVAERARRQLEAADDDQAGRHQAVAWLATQRRALKGRYDAGMAAWRVASDEWIAQRKAEEPACSEPPAPSAALDAVEGDNPAPSETWTRKRIPYVDRVEYVHMPTTKRYGAAESFLRVTLTAPNLVTTLRSLLWTPVAHGGTPTRPLRQEEKRPAPIRFVDGAGAHHTLPQDDLAECKVEFYMRYMIDQRLEMCEWVEVVGAEFMDSTLCDGSPGTAFLAARHDAVTTLAAGECKRMPPAEFLECGMDIETRNTVIWGPDEEVVDEATGHTKRQRTVRGARFPNAKEPDNSVQCICLALHPNGEAVAAASEERKRCLAEGLRWEDRDGDRKTILRRQREAELRGGWYEVFYWGRVNEQRVRERRAEKSVRFHAAQDEYAMIRMFRDRLAELRAEVPLTWNGNAFDVPYLSDRIELHYKHRARDVFNVADMVGATSDWAAERETWAAKEARFQSKQAGKRGGRDILWPGMPWCDVMQTVIRNYKFRSYKLDAVAEHFLGEHKDDMDPAQITPTWDRDEDGAADVVAYCCWDAELPWRISQVNKLTENMMQMARVTKVPPQALLTRGQAIKSYIQILVMAAERGYLVHHHEAPPSAFDAKRTEAKYKGAVVIEPVQGFYRQPVIVLDFSSLYPSEAISHNLCYTTYVPPECLADVPEADRFQTPAGHWFVKPSVRRGLVPDVLRRLLAARKATRADATTAENDGDMATAASLDNRQLNYKVSANSIYGFMGSDASLPCFAVSESITAYGREDIMAVKALIESTYPGYRVVYGDTDSVMVASPDTECGDEVVAAIKAPADLRALLDGDERYATAFRRFYGDDATVDALVARDGLAKVARETVDMAARVRAIATMHEMAGLVNRRFKEDSESIMSLTPEKIYTNYLLLSKKRYSGMYWTKPEKADKVRWRRLFVVPLLPWFFLQYTHITPQRDAKGLENVRRDFAPITSEVVDGVLRRIVAEGSVEAAADYAREQIGLVVSGRVPFTKLVISKKFSRAAEDYAAPQPHITVNQRVARRDPGREKLEGDRIEYVLTTGHGKTFEQAEDPRYVLENNIPIDYRYYYEKQLRKPVHRLFRRVMDEQRIESEIFNGPHMRQRAAAPTRKDAGGIGQFVVARKRSADDSAAADSVADAPAARDTPTATTATATTTDGGAPRVKRTVTRDDAGCLARFVQPVADRAAAMEAQFAKAAAAAPTTATAPTGRRAATRRAAGRTTTRRAASTAKRATTKKRPADDDVAVPADKLAAPPWAACTDDPRFPPEDADDEEMYM